MDVPLGRALWYLWLLLLHVLDLLLLTLSLGGFGLHSFRSLVLGLEKGGSLADLVVCHGRVIWISLLILVFSRLTLSRCWIR